MSMVTMRMYMCVVFGALFVTTVGINLNESLTKEDIWGHLLEEWTLGNHR